MSPQPITWLTSIDGGDLSSLPTSVDDANVVSSAQKETLVVSANITGGTAATVDVSLCVFDAISNTFVLTGDVYRLDPSTANFAVFDPRGLVVGFVAIASGGPASFSLNVGTR